MNKKIHFLCQYSQHWFRIIENWLSYLYSNTYMMFQFVAPQIYWAHKICSRWFNPEYLHTYGFQLSKSNQEHFTIVCAKTVKIGQWYRVNTIHWLAVCFVFWQVRAGNQSTLQLFVTNSAHVFLVEPPTTATKLLETQVRFWGTNMNAVVLKSTVSHVIWFGFICGHFGYYLEIVVF